MLDAPGSWTLPHPPFFIPPKSISPVSAAMPGPGFFAVMLSNLVSRIIAKTGPTTKYLAGGESDPARTERLPTTKLRLSDELHQACLVGIRATWFPGRL